MSTESAVAGCVQTIRQRWRGQPRAAIVLGTGLGGLADHIDTDVEFAYSDLEGFAQPTAVAHKGQLVCGTLEGVPVVAMQGRVHYYEGFNFSQITFPVRVAARLGCELLLVSNASGGLNPQYRSGDIMVIEGHIDLMGNRNAGGALGTVNAPRLERVGEYDRELIELALAVGRQENFGCHAGVYVAVMGPNYETRAEYRFMRRIGGDAVGMSTAPELIAARRADMRVLALSAITNIARPDAPDAVDALEVVDIAGHAEPKLRAIALRVLRSL